MTDEEKKAKALDIQKRISRNRTDINNALFLEDLDLTYSIVRMKTAQNEKLIKQLQEL